MYNFSIFLYATAVRLVSPFKRKARLMVDGHKDVFEKLETEIDKDSKYIWIHAASLGEFEQARPLIEKLKQEHSEYKILLTFFSPSGYEVRKNYELADIICYLPFDLKKNARKFVKLANPSIAIFIKYEFWKNYIKTLHKNNIPTYIVSAIFRPNQIFFRWYGKFMQKVLHSYTALCVQDENSKTLLEGIGVKNVHICGDTRFDRVLKIKGEAKNLTLLNLFTTAEDGSKIKTLVAGSSWPKDEDIFVPYFNSTKNMKLIIAPHEIHESHLMYIEDQVKRPCIRYSKATTDTIANYDCIIIDSFGLLSSIYGYGEVAYIGGGFGVGIHNVLEAAVYGIPTIFGPNFKKFREARDLLERGGSYSVHDYLSFKGLMDDFIDYPDTLKMAGQQAEDYVSANANVVDKVMKIINP